MPSAGRELRAQAGTVDRLFVTHADFDHYGGAQAFADLPILASEQTAKTIREVGPGRERAVQQVVALVADERRVIGRAAPDGRSRTQTVEDRSARILWSRSRRTRT